MDGWDFLLIAVAIAIVGSSIEGWYKSWKKRKNNPYKYSDETHDVTVWLPDGKIDNHFDATEVDVRDRYICITFDDGTDIEYEGVKFKVVTSKIKL